MSHTKVQKASWSTCKKCNINIPTLALLQKHSEGDCSEVFPSYSEEKGSLLIEVASEDSFRGVSLPSGALNIDLTDKIYVRDSILLQCHFYTSEWVSVKTVQESLEGKEPLPPLAFQIRPLRSEEAGTCFKALLSSASLKLHSTLVPETVYCIERFKSRGKFDLASAIVVEVEGKSADFDLKRLENSFKLRFRNRPLTVGNQFLMQYYAQLIRIRISSITIPPDVFQFASTDFYEVSQQTNIVFVFAQDTEDKKLKSRVDRVTIEDIGGLDTQTREVLDTIKYITEIGTSGSNIARGILIHGHYGTGKSLFTQAICNILNYEQYVIDEYSQSKEEFNQHVRKYFAAAARCTNGAAIIIENLDGLAPNVSRNEKNSTFSSVLRNQMDWVQSQKSKVVILATTSNLDQIDPALRSPHIFCKEIEIPVPAMPERHQIIRKLIRKLDHELDEDGIREIANSTSGYVGADLQSLFAEAVLHSKGPFTVSCVLESLQSVRPSALKSILIETPNVLWSDIGGMDDVKFKLQQCIQWPLTNPKAFTRLGITPPKGVLMFGPPGCSKTMIAKAIATQSGVNFVSVKGSELFSKWVGESEKAIQKLFQKARQVAPCVLFFDEIDAIGGVRSGEGSTVNDRVLAQILVEMDGIEQLENVTIVAATNRPDMLDQALMRPGRLDRLIYVSLPDDSTREQILSICIKKMPTSISTVDWLVELTAGYSGAEIVAICQEAGMQALQEDIEATEVNEEHFRRALETVVPRTPKETVEFYDRYALEHGHTQQ